MKSVIRRFRQPAAPSQIGARTSKANHTHTRHTPDDADDMCDVNTNSHRTGTPRWSPVRAAPAPSAPSVALLTDHIARIYIWQLSAHSFVARCVFVRSHFVYMFVYVCVAKTEIVQHTHARVCAQTRLAFGQMSRNPQPPSPPPGVTR